VRVLKNPRPEGAVELEPQVYRRLTKRAVGHKYLPPFQGGHWANVFQGLKPLAESFHPFGIRPTSPFRNESRWRTTAIGFYVYPHRSAIYWWAATRRSEPNSILPPPTRSEYLAPGSGHNLYYNFWFRPVEPIDMHAGRVG